MFVSMSQFEVPAADAAAIEEAFANRPRQVDSFPGFLGLEVYRDSLRRGRMYLLTRWRNREDFQTYMRSDAFKSTHQQPHGPTQGVGLIQMETFL